MFYLTYLRQELRRRLGRTLFTVFGLAVGVALVVAVTALSAGLDKAQSKVLGPLAGVGTDMTVTKQSFLPGGGAGIAFLTGGLQTDLSKLGNPGQQFSTDSFFNTQPAFNTNEPTKIASVNGVQTTSQALVLRGIHQSGTIPKITATVTQGAQTVTQTQAIAPMTPTEQTAFNNCMAANTPQQTPAPSGGGGGGFGEGDGGGRGRFAAVQKCLPARFSKAIQTFRVPGRTFQQDVNTPQTNIQTQQFTVAGIQPHADISMITAAQVTSGRFISTNGEALVSESYASDHKLKVGSTLTLKSTKYNVVGVVQPPLGGQAVDVYLTLSDLQTVSGHSGEANIVLARATTASMVTSVSSAIKNDLPATDVSNASDLAKNVAGSLVDSGNLIKRLGLVLAIVGLVAAFLIAILLTLSSIAKRTRELGTLKAIGWGPRLVVRQIIGETMTQGVLGGVIGIALGIGAAALLGSFAPSLSARAVDAAGPGRGGFGFGRFAQQASTAVRLTAPVKPSWLVIAAVLAVVGGLIAGAIGAMRVARLRPADAMREVN